MVLGIEQPELDSGRLTISSAKATARALPGGRWGSLPPCVKGLFITAGNRTQDWLANAFADDRASDVTLEEAMGAAFGMQRLREQPYDVVFVSHEPGQLDALDLIEGLRAGGLERPVIVLGTAPEQELSILCFEVGADAYVCIDTATTRGLLWVVARALERHALLRQNQRLMQAEQRRLEQEHGEAKRVLTEQRGMIRDLHAHRALQPDGSAGEAAADVQRLAAPICEEAPDLQESLRADYRELLRAHVMMGSGNLAADLAPLAEQLAGSGVSARQIMQLHVHALGELIRGLGSRSARHVMSRADLLILEMMVHLSESYRRRWLERSIPPRQQLLPGFD